MKEKLKKIIKSLKKIAKWLFKNIKWVVLAIGSVFVVMTVKRLVANIGKVSAYRNWDPVPGDKTKVFIWDKDSNRKVVKLPVNPKDNKQITSDEIKTIGLADNSDGEEDLYVEILHTPINRRNK